ncbi:hypothetical protein [Noviherbaspirillum sedimenti]|nr:hypothetical protein [Noviherbaspirillum sedimenti]
MPVLGIESSCDETGVALLGSGGHTQLMRVDDVGLTRAYTPG